MNSTTKAILITITAVAITVCAWVYYEHDGTAPAPGATSETPNSGESAAVGPNEKQDLDSLSDSDGTSDEVIELDPEKIGEAENGQHTQQVSDHPFVSEETLVTGISLNQASIIEVQMAGNFDQIINGLRESSGLIGANKRSELESILYTRPEINRGQISISSFECGQMLCAGEFVGNDVDSLDAFVTSLTEGDLFQMGSIIQLPVNRPGQSGSSINIVISHDPTIKGISMNP